MEKSENLSSDLILYIQKLLLSISTFHKHLSSLTEKQENILTQSEESNIKHKVMLLFKIIFDKLEC